MKIKIATRQSPLALWQAEHVKSAILAIEPDFQVELVGIKTIADKFLETRLQKIGGKGLFVKELEEALLAEHCDIAVHSMKDVPYQLPDGLEIMAYLSRHDPSDCLVSSSNVQLDELPAGAVVGTSSLRRMCQLKTLRADLEVKAVRGNVNTRLKKLDEGEFDALLMATAGLERLGFQQRIAQRFTHQQMLPAVGQGIVGIEARTSDQQIRQLLQRLNHPESETVISAERRLNECLEGNCHLPVAAHADLNQDKQTISLTARVGSVTQLSYIEAMHEGKLQDPAALGELVAESLLQQGAQTFIDEARQGI